MIALVRAVFRRESRLRVGDKIVEGVARHIDNGIAGQAAALDLQEPSPLTWACDALAVRHRSRRFGAEIDRDGGVQRQGWPRPFGASRLSLPFLGVRRGEERRAKKSDVEKARGGRQGPPTSGARDSLDRDVHRIAGNGVDARNPVCDHLALHDAAIAGG